MEKYSNVGEVLSGESPVNVAYDLHTKTKDDDQSAENQCGYYWICYEVDGETQKEEYRAFSLNEAIGAFLVEHEDMTYSDIIDHFEV